MPTNNRLFWEEKFKANFERDGRNERALRRLGLRVVKVWECQTAAPKRLERRLSNLLKKLEAGQ